MVETVQHWSYDQLKRIAVEEVAPSPRELEILKDIYAAEIDSVRRRECIHSVAALVDCLERRDALSPENIEPLRELADHCGGRRLQEALCAYVTPKAVTAVEPINQYQEMRLSEQLRVQMNINGGGDVNSTSAVPMQRAPTVAAATATPYPVALTEQKRAAVYKVIAQEIGRYWRPLGRELELGEGAMDELEVTFPRDVSSRVYRLLQLFEEDECHDPKQHVLFLCRALESCQRKDLRRKVENIMSH